MGQVTTQIGQLSNQLNQVVTSLHVREKWTFLAQPLANSKGQFKVGSTSNSAPQEHLQGIATLRSGKVFGKDVPPKVVKPQTSKMLKE